MKHNPYVLELKDITISFSAVTVLSHASFFLKHNEIHAIVGKNGAGKSSFMKALTGVYIPDSGSITIDGEPVTLGSSKTVSQEKVAMVYQDLSLVPSLTVLQNIFLSYHPYKVWGILQDKKARKVAKELLEQVGISSLSLDSYVSELSAGESQLVEIAKAIAGNPNIIVFDEPTASLSDFEIKRLFETIERLRVQGHAIIYITHYLEDVMQLCDSVTVLRDGKVISTTATEHSTIESIVKDMLGEQESVVTVAKSVSKNVQEEHPYIELESVLSKKVGPMSLKAYAGEIIGIAGLLGSGRTELFELMYGLDPIVSGDIRIHGSKVSVQTPSHAIKQGIVLVPEERRTQGLVMDFDIEENMSLASLQKSSVKGMLDMEKRAKIADSMISSLQIKTTGRKQLVRLLSGGNQQKVVIGKCLTVAPKILLLDDPTFGVDIHAKREIMNIIKDYAQQGNIVFFISSEFSEIVHFCDRTYIVKKGTITKELSNDSLHESDLLVQVQ